MRMIFLIMNAALLTVGSCAGPLIMRLYFTRGGNRIWFSSWLESAGFPIILIPLIYSYCAGRGTHPSGIISMNPKLCSAAAVVGVLAGLDNYLYAYGVAKLPVSTSSLIIASQLGFTAVFAYLIVKQKFTAFSINAVVLLTVAAGILALHSNGDRPKGESNGDYYTGFVLTLAAAALYGLMLPLVELAYAKTGQDLNYDAVLKFQFVLGFFATLACTIGMAVSGDFPAIPTEARGFQLGEGRYYAVVVSSAIIWQCFFLGNIGVIFYSSALLSGVLISVLLPPTEILAVLFFREKFQAEKGVSLFLSLFGFVSYFYGEYK
ncbi:hypothetical protein M569_07351, partial [Genlisea aurea]